jgi:zinc protease
VLGTAASLDRISVEDARAFHRAWVAPGTSALVVAGHFDEDEAMRLAAAGFGGWRGEAATPPSLRSQPVRTNGPPQRVARAGLSQALITFGRRGAAVADADQAPLDLVSLVLGRELHRVLRNQLDLTYGVQVSTYSWRGLGELTGSLRVRSDAIGRALDATADVLRRAARAFASYDATTVAFLRDLKERQARTLTSRFDGVEGAVAAARLSFVNELPLDWIQRYRASLDAVTVGDMNRVSALYLAPQDLHIVLVADPAPLDALRYDWPPPLPVARPSH